MTTRCALMIFASKGPIAHLIAGRAGTGAALEIKKIV